MINAAKSYTVEEYIEIMRRRIWYIIIPFIAIVLGGTIYCVFAPREYKASALILVAPQRVPESFVPATVTAKIEERLQSIAQEVMSRTRLEQIISEFKLYEREQKMLSREEVIELMQKNIKVELPKKEERGYFTISYTGSDQNIVATITNRLTSQFIEENLKFREQQAVGTTEFLSTELTTAKEKLDEMEAAVAQYKRRFMGELPEQRDTNLKILEQLQGQYQRSGESLRAAQDRKLFIQKQLTDLELPIDVQASGANEKESKTLPGKASYLQKEMASSARVSKRGGPYQTQKESLTRTLEDLRTKYTDNHPDVIATKKKLADLEDKKDLFDVKNDPRYKELNNQLVLNDMEIKRLGNEERTISTQMQKYRARVEQTPSREQDMAALMREYRSTSDEYARLLRKSQEAQQAENLEKRQKGEQFRVIDPARMPEKPSSPDIPKIIFISLFAGVGSGFGLAFFREQLDRSFHDAGDVEVSLGLKVLANIPRIEEKAA